MPFELDEGPRAGGLRPPAAPGACRKQRSAPVRPVEDDDEPAVVDDGGPCETGGDEDGPAVREAEEVAGEVMADLVIPRLPFGPRRPQSAFPSVHAEGGAPARRGGRKPRPGVPVPNEVDPVAPDGTFFGFVGESEPLRAALAEIERAARTDVTVLLIGESGTGKELAARAIHLLSRRRSAPFVAIHTGAIPRELVASELFGHERGAFTGATRQQRGKFEIANFGSLFLDEVATMDQLAQVSLLRVMENREFARVGSETTIRVDVRLIAATNADLSQVVERGEFREDLYYRLHVFPVRLPPLRARPGDVDLLVDYFLRQFTAETALAVTGVSEEALELLRAYPWPGNVRELRNAIQRAVIRAEEGVIEPRHLPERIRGRTAVRALELEVGLTLADVERRYIRETLARCCGNKKETAKMLGISRKSLYNKLQRYKIA
jgi:transcriptional regulator with PAS, ATPase and Fis domain